MGRGLYLFLRRIETRLDYQLEAVFFVYKRIISADRSC
jgi:hypothetical protein